MIGFVRWLSVLLASWVAFPAYAQVPDSTRDSLPLGHGQSGALLRRLPIDDPRHALALLPGVLLRGDAIGIATVPRLSIRGSLTAPSEYLDGASIRFQATQTLGLAPQELAGITIATGVAPVFLPDANGGVVLYETPEGGERLAGDVRWDSDEPFGNGSTVGYNRIHGALSGPLSRASHVTFFLSSTLHGQRSSYRGMGAAAQPTFLPGGLDTTVSDGGGGSVALPRWVQWSGECDPGDNAGVECQALRRPLDWSTAQRVQGKVSYRYGTGSSLSISGLVGDLQQRFFPGQVAAARSLYSGGRMSSTIGIVNWSHALGEWRGGPLTLNANVSFVRQRGIVGLLEPESELSTRDPYLGIAFETLDFAGADIIPLPLTQDIVNNVRLNTGLRAPYLGREDLRNQQPYRMNPFGLAAGWPTDGLDGPLAFATERRVQGRGTLEWLAGAHRVVLGLDAERSALTRYSSSLLSQSFFDAWIAHPSRIGIFAGDRVALGRAVVDLGLRYDRFAPGGELPLVPGRIYTNPAFNRPASLTDPDSLAASVARVFRPTSVKHAVSPRVRVTYALTGATTLHAGYARTVEAPPWSAYFQGANNDLDFTNVSAPFGRDVDFVTAAMIEAGVRALVTPRMALDLAVYRKGLPWYRHLIRPFADPFNPGDTINLLVLSLEDGGHALGADARLEWQAGSWLSASASYAVSGARGAIPGPLGPIAAKVTTHMLAATAVVRVPEDWQAGSLLGTLARDAGAVILLRATSGLPFTRLINAGLGVVAPDEVGPIGLQIEPLNASRLPWTKHLDLRVTKGVRAGGRDWTLYADARNLLNFRNTFALFAETGGVVNDQHRALFLAGEYANLRNEAASNSALGAGDEIDLSACATWAGAGPVTCVVLRRTEARFGNGDGTYTAAEQVLVLNAYYDAFFAPSRFYGMGRTLRIGAQLAF